MTTVKNIHIPYCPVCYIYAICKWFIEKLCLSLKKIKQVFSGNGNKSK